MRTKSMSITHTNHPAAPEGQAKALDDGKLMSEYLPATPSPSILVLGACDHVLTCTPQSLRLCSSDHDQDQEVLSDPEASMSTLSGNTSSFTSATALSPNSSSTSNSDFFETPSRLSGMSFLSAESHELDFDIDLSSVEIGYATQVDVGRQTPSFQQAWGEVKPRTNRRPSGLDDGLEGGTGALSLRSAKSVPSLRRLRSVRSPSPIPVPSPRRSVSLVEIPENERGSHTSRDSFASTLPALTAVPQSSSASDLQDRLEVRLLAIEASLAGLQAALSPLARLSGIEEQINKLVSTAASRAQTAALEPRSTPSGWTMPRLGLPHQTTGPYASPYPYPGADPNGLALPHLYSIPLGHPVGRSSSPGLSTGYNQAPAPAAYHGRRSSSNSINIGFSSHSPYPGATTNVEPQFTALERERTLFQRESAVRRREEAVDRRERAFAAYAAGYGSVNGSPNLGVTGATGMSAPPSIPSCPGSARGMGSLSASRETVLEVVNEPDVSGRAARSHTHTHAHSHSLSTSVLHVQPPTQSPAPHPPLTNRYSGLLGITLLLSRSRNNVKDKEKDSAHRRNGDDEREAQVVRDSMRRGSGLRRVDCVL